MRRGTRSCFAALAVAAAVLAGCSSDGPEGSEGSDAKTGTSTTVVGSTTAAPEDLAAEPVYALRGANEVGTSTIALEDGRRVVVWYPATEEAGSQPLEIFDIASLLSPGLQEKIPTDKRPQYEINAHPGAEPATDGPYPVVLFSHGYAGFPEQSANLVTHLASWGFVVVAPDHVERSLSGILGTAAQGVPKQEDPAVLSLALDAAIADAERAESPLNGLIDVERVAVIGHSAGAGASYRTASSEPRIKAFIAYSIGQRSGADAPPVPEVPGMVMAGTADATIEHSASVAVYEGLSAPRYLVSIGNAGHLVFSDICLIGQEMGGLTGLIAEVGLDLPEQFSRLANDGCQEGALNPMAAFDAINHLSVAFLRSSLGLDAEPVGLDPAVTAAFPDAEITLTADAG